MDTDMVAQGIASGKVGILIALRMVEELPGSYAAAVVGALWDAHYALTKAEHEVLSHPE